MSVVLTPGVTHERLVISCVYNGGGWDGPAGRYVVGINPWCDLHIRDSDPRGSFHAKFYLCHMCASGGYVNGLCLCRSGFEVHRGPHLAIVRDIILLATN